MGKKLVVSKSCNACGLCIGNKYIEEREDGMAQPTGTGIISLEDMSSVEELRKKCPQGAILVEEVGGKTKEEIIQLINQKVSGFKITVPAKSAFAYDKNNFAVNNPVYAPGENRYEYSSYQRAKNAAAQAIDRLMYSKRKSIIQDIIADYQAKVLRPYSVYEESEKNFYYSANRKAQEILKQILEEIQIYKGNTNCAANLTKIETRPVLNKNKNYKMLEITDDLQVRAECILNEMSGQYYSLDYYADRCDIDDSEEWVGTGMFGKDKYETKYCFRDTRDAFEDIAKDISDACKSYFSEHIIDNAYLGVEGITEEYERVLKKELEDKARALSKEL